MPLDTSADQSGRHCPEGGLFRLPISLVTSLQWINNPEAKPGENHVRTCVVAARRQAESAPSILEAVWL